MKQTRAMRKIDLLKKIIEERGFEARIEEREGRSPILIAQIGETRVVYDEEDTID